MKLYWVYFKIGSKGFKMKVDADNKALAMVKVKEKIEFVKCEEVNDPLTEMFDNFFGK